MASQLGEVEERLGKLEAQTRRRKHFGAIVIVACAAAILSMGQTANRQIVKTEEVLLVDKNGIPMGRLAVSDRGPNLTFYDVNGKVRAILAVADEGPGLAFTDENERLRMGVMVVEGGPDIRLYDSEGRLSFKAR